MYFTGALVLCSVLSAIASGYQAHVAKLNAAAARENSYAAQRYFGRAPGLLPAGLLQSVYPAPPSLVSIWIRRQQGGPGTSVVVLRFPRLNARPLELPGPNRKRGAASSALPFRLQPTGYGKRPAS